MFKIKPLPFGKIGRNIKYFITHFYKKDFIFPLIKKYRVQLFYGIGTLIAIILLIPFFTYIYFASDLKDKDNIMNRSKTGLTLLDEDGNQFFSFYNPKEVTYVPLSDMPAYLRQAVVSSEDKNFYTNPGFSFRGIARAFIRNIAAGKIVEGGSTITQELVKTALLNSNRNFLRKYQEIVLASEINRKYSKNDILEMYFNSVYFGEGAFGIENASQAYFGIPSKDLTLPQSSLLVGLLPAPSALSPISNDPQRAKKRQKIVLYEMVRDGKITQAQADEAANTPLVYSPAPKEDTNVLAHHFALYVKDFLIEKYGEERIIREGFQVRTTLNSKWQEFAERTVKNQVAYLEYNNATNGAAVAIYPRTGAIKVMVGSHDWNDDNNGKINMALSPRQPGSSFKPIIYAKALEEKMITPASILSDDPVTYPGNYKPQDYDKRNRGPVTARRALANSLNIPAVEVMDKVGINDGLDMAKRLGITTLNKPSDYGLSLVLGAAEVRLLDLTNAYAVFADKGIYNTPNPIIEIKNKYGKLVDTPKLAQKEVIGEDVAYLISSILSDNSARAEAFGGLLTISRPAAVKTGTTEDYRDALTVGYTPSLVVGVWVGNNDNKPMDNIAGSLGAAPIWRSLMENFLAGTPLERFIKPYNVVDEMVCPYKGLSSPSASASAYLEHFMNGTQPQNSCQEPTKRPTATPEPTNSPKPTSEPTDTPEPTETPIIFPTDIPPVQQNTPQPTILPF